MDWMRAMTAEEVDWQEKGLWMKSTPSVKILLLPIISAVSRISNLCALSAPRHVIRSVSEIDLLRGDAFVTNSR
jgi:hypothetical protein